MVWTVYHKSDQFIEFAAIAFAAVTPKDIARSHEICGFTNDTGKHKWASKLRNIVASRPQRSDLPEELQIAYDPTGNSVIRRWKNRANRTNLKKQ